MKTTAMIAVLAAALLGSTASLAAPAPKTYKIASYPYEQVMPAAVRFLRVDEKHKLLEKDYKAGYILFEVKEGARAFRGALELIRIRDRDGRPAVKLVMHIEDRPKYMALVKLNRLLRKLRKQLGVPVPPASTHAPPAKTPAVDKKAGQRPDQKSHK